jgi:membrane-associated phospholipid phosphatase
MRAAAYRSAWRRLGEADRALFHRVAALPGSPADSLLGRLTASADNGLLWYAAAAALAATGTRGRRAAVRGLTSLGVSSVLANGPAKVVARRGRPMLDPVPHVRRLAVQPTTLSFPSGHSASAAGFATGAALELPWSASVVGPLAAAVAYGRVHTGVHYPADVAAGLTLGVGAALAMRRLWPRPSP